MYTKIFAAAVLSLGMGTAAIAQGDGEQGSSRLFDWDSTVSGAFFSDPEMTTMRTEEEMTTNWSALTPEQQTMVREDCEDEVALPQQEIDGIEQICEFVDQQQM